jgi:hypothetical protein
MGKGDPQGGRPPFELSDEEFGKLLNMVRIQCTQEEICGIYGVTDKTLNEALRRRGEPGFSEFYKKHQDEGRASLRRAQWKAAQDGNPTMLVWLGKQMLGQRDRKDLDHTSSDGTMTPAAIERIIVKPDAST